MKNSFTQASRGPKPDIKTKAELLHHIANRKRPMPERTLTPMGPQKLVAHRQAYLSTEKRIAQLKEGLNGAQGKLEKGLAHTRLHGKARMDFGHSR
ncbi:hypothetical protein FF098_017130 [Parvularcula flava]|uniref:Uncharacterized protein n=1 Tax=Aquisalinus luteolus TaxID=1566827 RepID=A0A8J3ESC7_9PROT|nr:hypothetical protein [Aquisalinus luteolus]NHK29634.1 hypothetical protein [Aquisalinus luteolus]GGI02267.1 hypothetical protein GCM10011355_34870 [Aquisalinus luteolus]